MERFPTLIKIPEFTIRKVIESGDKALFGDAFRVSNASYLQNEKKIKCVVTPKNGPVRLVEFPFSLSPSTLPLELEESDVLHFIKAQAECRIRQWVAVNLMGDVLQLSS